MASRQRRSYDQFCAVARALDHVSERWTLLIVRNLMLGPRRYSDLLTELPGITTNLLAARLRAMGVPCETLFVPYAQHAFDFVLGGFSDQILEAELLRFLAAQGPN